MVNYQVFLWYPRKSHSFPKSPTYKVIEKNAINDFYLSLFFKIHFRATIIMIIVTIALHSASQGKEPSAGTPIASTVSPDMMPRESSQVAITTMLLFSVWAISAPIINVSKSADNRTMHQAEGEAQNRKIACVTR